MASIALCGEFAKPGPTASLRIVDEPFVALMVNAVGFVRKTTDQTICICWHMAITEK